MNHLERLRYVTRRYPHLQGLRLVPLGIPFLISAAWRDGQLRWVPGIEQSEPSLWFAALFGVALMAGTLLGSYYRRRYGTVEPVRGWKAPVLFFGFLAVLGIAFSLQDHLQPIVSLPAVVIGTAIAYLGVVDRTIRFHYIVLGALCLLFANLGEFGIPVHARDVLLDDLIGLGLIAVGIGDHLVLRRTLEPVHNVEAF